MSINNARLRDKETALKRSLQSIPSLLWVGALCLLTSAAALAQDKTLTVRPIADAPSFVKRALVIGIGQYEHAGSLAPTTYNDAQRFADLLKTQFKFPEEAVTLLTDAPGTPDSRRPTYIHLLNALETLLAGINEKTEVIVYFSGHGIRVNDHDWLVPLDGLPSKVASTCINYDDFKSQLNTRVPARALLIVDACRNLSGGKDAGSSGFGAGKGLTGPQFAELLSCRPKEESKVGKPEDFTESVFTHFLLQGLQGDPEALDGGVVTFDSLNEYVQGRVSQYVSNKFGESQNPDGRASLGKMVLAKGTNATAPSTVPGPRAANPGIAVAKLKKNAKDDADMVFIPAGEFTMGSNESPNEKPVHKVMLDGYYIYRTPVTVAQYLRFCDETGHRRPEAPDFNPNWSKRDHPIVNVSYNDALAYCVWAGVKLPTEAQWEKAGRGTDERKYPWGDVFDRSKLWCSVSRLADAGGTKSAGSFPSGASPFGVLDMAGNVWQWCSDWYDPNFYASQLSTERNPENQSVGKKETRVTRGGSWVHYDPQYLRSAMRADVRPDNIGTLLGFRCASGL
ncbi:MAG: exported protein of unknown function [Chthonomonadaceae bacterium]|nr:exported protein of unknown function [Chthonomonadaceae bacterium]